VLLNPEKDLRGRTGRPAETSVAQRRKPPALVSVLGSGKPLSPASTFAENSWQD